MTATILTTYATGTYHASVGKHTASDALSACNAAKKVARRVLKTHEVAVREIRPNVWTAEAVPAK